MGNYFSENEATDFKKLEELNEKQNWFNYIEQLQLKSQIDASGYTKNDDVVFIEYKSRNISLQQAREYKYIFIEIGKLKAFNDITKKYQGKVKRLYINFLKNAVLIFNMNKSMDIKYLPNQMINNVGCGEYQIVDRLGLNVDDALVIYNTNPN